VAADGQASGQGSNLVASTTAALFLAAAAAAGRGASATRRRVWPLGKTARNEVVDPEGLSRGKERKEKKRRWFPFGRDKETETDENLKHLMEKTQDLASRVALLNDVPADVAQVDAQEEELPTATAEAAVNELEADTVEPAELLAEDTVDEASQVEKEPALEVAEMEEEAQEVDEALLAAAEEPLAATEAELPIVEEPEVDEAAAVEMSAATKVEAPPEGQEAAVDLVDEQRAVLESTLNLATVLEADNLKLKEDLKLAQKMCFELLDEKDLKEEPATAA